MIVLYNGAIFVACGRRAGGGGAAGATRLEQILLPRLPINLKVGKRGQVLVVVDVDTGLDADGLGDFGTSREVGDGQCRVAAVHAQKRDVWYRFRFFFSLFSNTSIMTISCPLVLVISASARHTRYPAPQFPISGRCAKLPLACDPTGPSLPRSSGYSIQRSLA